MKFPIGLIVTSLTLIPSIVFANSPAEQYVEIIKKANLRVGTECKTDSFQISVMRANQSAGFYQIRSTSLDGKKSIRLTFDGSNINVTNGYQKDFWFPRPNELETCLQNKTNLF